MDPIFLISTVLAILVVLGSVRYARRFVTAQDISAQLAAKDAVIETNRQTIESFETRIEQLEDQLIKANSLISEMKDEITQLRHQLAVQTKFSAPELGARVEANQHELAARIEQKLDRIIEALEE